MAQMATSSGVFARRAPGRVWLFHLSWSPSPGHWPTFPPAQCAADQGAAAGWHTTYETASAMLCGGRLVDRDAGDADLLRVAGDMARVAPPVAVAPVASGFASTSAAGRKSISLGRVERGQKHKLMHVCVCFGAWPPRAQHDRAPRPTPHIQQQSHCAVQVSEIRLLPLVNVAWYDVVFGSKPNRRAI